MNVGLRRLRASLVVFVLSLAGLVVHYVQDSPECHARGGEWHFYECGPKR